MRFLALASLALFLVQISLVQICEANDASDIVAHDWAQYRSAHFRLYSDLPEAVAAARIKELELFRAVVMHITESREFADQVPMEFYIFASARELTALINDGHTLGFTRPSLRSNVMVASTSEDGAQRNHIVFHEYVHYLVRGAGATYLPNWYDEGIAELLGSMEVRGSQVRIGVPPPGRLDAIRRGSSQFPITLAQVVNQDSSARVSALRSQFYGYAWALTHYLYSGHLSGREDRRPQIRRYLALVAASKPRGEAFREAFGVNVNSLESALNRYIDRVRLPALELPVSDFAFDWRYEKSVVDKYEIAYRLGYAALETNTDFSRDAFEIALHIRPQDAAALAGLGVAEQFDKEYEKGEPFARKAVELAPDNLLVKIELADLLMSWCRDPDKEDLQCELRRKEALSMYERIYRKDPQWLEGRFGLAAALVETRGDAVQARRLLRELSEQVPWFSVSDVWLAMAEAQLGHVAEAERLANQALYRSEDEVLGALAQQALDDIDHECKMRATEVHAEEDRSVCERIRAEKGD